MRRLLTTADVARALGLSRRTIQGWVADGKLTPSSRTTGGHAVFDPDYVATLVEWHTHQQAKKTNGSA